MEEDMQQQLQQFKEAWPKIVAKAWSDPEFKKQLLKNPAEALRSFGIEVPKNKKLVIQENKEDTIYLTLPEKPAGELTEEKLKSIAAAGSHASM
jgi:hypothetical protein